MKEEISRAINRGLGVRDWQGYIFHILRRFTDFLTPSQARRNEIVVGGGGGGDCEGQMTPGTKDASCLGVSGSRGVLEFAVVYD